MEKKKPSKYSKGYGVSSLGDYTSKGTFGKAFKAAHAVAGKGHTFDYNGKIYTTDCKDGGDYGHKDKREAWNHKIHEKGHAMNYDRKVEGKEGFEEWRITELLRFSKGKAWSKEVDLQRAEFHRREGEKISEKYNLYNL